MEEYIYNDPLYTASVEPIPFQWGSILGETLGEKLGYALFPEEMLYHTFFILEIVMFTQCLLHVISNHPSGVNSSLLQHSFHSCWNSQAECQ